LLETTPDCNPKHNSPSKTATGVDLASVRISPSRWLWHCTLIIYSAMLLSASFAIFPFLFLAFYWPIVWLIFLTLIIIALKSAWRAQQVPPIVLTVTQKIWRLQTADGEVIVELYDDVLVWAGVIILPMRETSTGQKHRIVALSDSMNADDWRRLRVWLRMGLNKNI
jgi:hypothetical protein